MIHLNIINTTSPTATFDKLRVIRTSLSGLTTALGNENRLGVREIQLWAGGQNLLQNVVGTVSSTYGAPTFNIVRLTRTRQGELRPDVERSYLIFYELELYINGENVALNTNGGTPSRLGDVHSELYETYINDGMPLNDTYYYHSVVGTQLGDYVQVELQNSHNINDLQSVIFYPRYYQENTISDLHNMDGVSLSHFITTQLWYIITK